MLDAVFITVMLSSGFIALMVGMIQNHRRGESFGIALLLGVLCGFATIVVSGALLGTGLTIYYQVFHHMPWLR